MQPAHLTRATLKTMTEETALTHVIKIFGPNEREPVRLALVDGGVKKVSDLKELTFEDFGQLEYEQAAASTASAVKKHLNILQRRKLVLIPLWFREQDNHELSTWFTLTADLFDSWRAQRPTGIEATQTLAQQDTSKKTSAAESFLKGVRRNVADYTKFKEAKQWQRWERHLQSTASAQGIDNVFDSAYAPTTPEDKALFNEQQKFGYKFSSRQSKPPKEW
jgi:hypothetical protein